MLWLQRGDRLPTVALVQHALGFDPNSVDGVFGFKTHRRVVDFQKKHFGLVPDGIVGPKTWAKLHPSYHCSLINVLDTADRSLVPIGGWLKQQGGDPITPDFRSNALDYINRMAAARSRAEGPIGLLRIIGHGNVGAQNLSLGKGGHWLDEDPTCVGGVRETIKTKKGPREACHYTATKGEALTFESLELVKQYLAPLKSCFSPLGSIELHGCKVADTLKGQKLVFALAVTLGVPVTATLGTSRVASEKQILRFESSTSSWFPLAGDLESWARAGARKAIPSKRYQLSFRAA